MAGITYNVHASELPDFKQEVARTPYTSEQHSQNPGKLGWLGQGSGACTLGGWW